MLKMLLDPMGGIVMTNDGNCILREIDVAHPAAKSMIELSRSQDEEVGDGTTSVIILAGALLAQAQQFIEKEIHPTVLVRAYHRALEHSLAVCDRLSTPINVDNMDELSKVVRSCIGTKYSSRFGELMVDMAISAVLKVHTRMGQGARSKEGCGGVRGVCVCVCVYD